MRAPRFNTQAVDLAGFEAWLRGQLVGPAFAAVVTVVLQMIRALFEQNLLLRMRLAGRRPKPPSERFDVIERQLAFAFAVPTNDVTPTPAPAHSATPDDEAEKKPRAKPTPRAPLPKHCARIEVPNNVPDAERFCAPCNVPMTRVCVRVVETLEVIPGRIVVSRRLDETVACPRCDAIVCAKAPPSVLDGGLLGPVLGKRPGLAITIECPRRGLRLRGLVASSPRGRGVRHLGFRPLRRRGLAERAQLRGRIGTSIPQRSRMKSTASAMSLSSGSVESVVKRFSSRS